MTRTAEVIHGKGFDAEVNGRLVVQVPPSVQKREQYVRGALTEWYREHALEKLREKVDRYSKVVRVTPASVNIKTFKAR